MPRSKDFFIYAPAKSGAYKDKRLLGRASGQSLSLQDLIDFLKEKGVNDLSKVALPSSFITTAKI